MNDLLARLIADGCSPALVAEVAMELGRAQGEREQLADLRAKDRVRSDGYRERRGLSEPEWLRLVGEVVERDGLICRYCMCDINADGLAWAVDHIVPLIKGGTNDLGNLVVACKPCNSSKAGRSIEEWRR